MKPPTNMTEAEVLASIERAVGLLAGRFVFGSWDLDDVKQYGRMEAIRAMDRYDPSRPLDNFLYSHIKNRYINLLRDKYRRNDPPCRACHEGDGCDKSTAYSPFCPVYAAWLERNRSKANLMSPGPLQDVADGDQSGDVEIAELEEIIRQEIPFEMLRDYLALKDGDRLPAARRAEIEAAVRDVLSFPV